MPVKRELNEVALWFAETEGDHMKAPPEPWRVHNGRDPEADLRRLNRRFQAISRGFDRVMTLRRLDRWASIAALTVIGSCAFYWGLVIFSPWPPMMTLKHIAAFPNCAAARAVGLAPAKQGEPGFWHRQDRDGDGTSCEPSPHREHGRWAS